MPPTSGGSVAPGGGTVVTPVEADDGAPVLVPEPPEGWPLTLRIPPIGAIGGMVLSADFEAS